MVEPLHSAPQPSSTSTKNTPQCLITSHNSVGKVGVTITIRGVANQMTRLNLSTLSPYSIYMLSICSHNNKLCVYGHITKIPFLIVHIRHMTLHVHEYMYTVHIYTCMYLRFVM